MKEKVVTEQVKTEADKIWDDIKDRDVEMFALPNQKVNNYCKPVNIEPSKLYLTFSASAIFPALEVALKGKYNVENINKYLIVSRVEKSLLD